MAVEKFFDFIIEKPSWLLVGLGAYTAVYLVSRLFARPKAGKNPFATDHRRPKETFIADSQIRDSVLKQRFKSSKVAEDLDVVVVGSGAGGLVSALLLARGGKKVLVLEQHDQAGGCCHTFVEKGYEFDTGVHYIGDMDNTESRQLLDQLTGGQLDWAPMADEFDKVVLGDPEKPKVFPMKSGRQRYFDNLIQLFPEEKEAILKYEQLIEESAGSFGSLVAMKLIPRYVMTLLIRTRLVYLFFSCFKFTHSLQHTLDQLTSNDDLKATLSYICGDYGVMPKEVPFLLHSVLIRHYWNGAYYPVGGPSELVYHLVKGIESHGGRVLVQAPVSNILCDHKGRAVGVRVKRSSGDVDIKAKRVVSDAGVINTFQYLLPPEVARKSYLYPMVEKVGPSLSFITTFVGVEGDPAELNLPSGNTWYYNSTDINKAMTDYLATPYEDVAAAPLPLCYISFPSAKDPTWKQKHPGKCSVLIITLSSYDWFASWEDGRLRHRGEDYESLKDSIGEQMWRICCQLYPQLQGKKDYMEVGSPVTNKHYLGQPSGEMYGLDQRSIRFTPEVISNLRATTDIPGLYLTGQDSMTCGLTSVVYAGLITASQMLGRNLLSDFSKLNKTLNQQKELNHKLQ